MRSAVTCAKSDAHQSLALTLRPSSQNSRRSRSTSVEVFLDQTNLQYGLWGGGFHRPNYGDVVRVAVEEFGEWLRRGRPESGVRVCCDKVWCFASKAVNTHPDDTRRVQGRERFLHALERRHGFTMVTAPLDFHGYHMAQDRRRASDVLAEREWTPVEKGVDTSLSAYLTWRATARDGPDGIVVMSGDADYEPVIAFAKEINPHPWIAVAALAGSLSDVYWRSEALDAPPILLDAHLDRIRDKSHGGVS